MKNILYISYDGMTDPLGQSQVLPYLEGLSAGGYKFHLISFEKESNYEQNKAVIKNIVDNAGIVWIPLQYTKKPPVLSTIYDVWQMKRTAAKLHKTVLFNIVHCRSYIAAFAGIYLKRKFGVKFIFDIRGFWADERVEGGIWNLNNPVFNVVYKFFKNKEKHFFNTADYTVSLTNAAKNIINSWSYLKNRPIPIEVIPCCADFDHFKESQQQKELTSKLKQHLKIHNSDFVISYLGSIGTWYMLDEMLDLFKVLLTAKPESKFLFITAEPKELILEKAEAKGIEHSRLIIRKAQRNEVPAYIALSRVSIFFIKPSFSKQASSPTKMAEIMGMGIPVICNSNVGDVESFVRESNTGLIVSDFTVSAYLKVIEKLNESLLPDKQIIREAAINEYSLKMGVERYGEVYNRVLE